jgi:ubiquinone/menaquinone biosynthesis C-methylase UbiE
VAVVEEPRDRRGARARQAAKALVRTSVPGVLAGAALRRSASGRQRAVAGAALVGLWSVVYARYRQFGKARTAWEYEQLASTNWDAFNRHYNERVPTVEEEFDIWGEYHQHRHEMRYDLVAQEVRRHLPVGGRVLDVGCGSALVADRLLDVAASYVGLDFGGHHIAYATKKLRDRPSALRGHLVRGDGEQLPFPDASFDVLVMSEVIEHLLRPELAVWEVSRVLRPGGVYVMTTNNASEMPLQSPLSHLPAWVEKALGVHRPSLVSMRPWVWPEAVDPELLPAGSPPVYIPHTHHIQAETRRLFEAAGLDTFHFSTFEFPPPQSATARWLERRGEPGKRAVDALELVAQRTPLVNRMGCHLFMLSRKARQPVAVQPPPGIWPGPLSGGAVQSARSA